MVRENTAGNDKRHARLLNLSTLCRLPKRFVLCGRTEEFGRVSRPLAAIERAKDRESRRTFLDLQNVRRLGYDPRKVEGSPLDFIRAIEAAGREAYTNLRREGIFEMYNTLTIKETVEVLKDDKLEWSFMLGGEEKEAEIQIASDFIIITYGGFCKNEKRFSLKDFKAKKNRYEEKYFIKLNELSWLEGELRR